MKLLAFAARQPELQRQLWLEFSPTRLLAMPLVLALVFTGIALAGRGALATAAQLGFVALVWAYGARLASAALTDELHEGTWDAQRLSSLSAWQLAAGKLFGGTAFAWYGGAICLAVAWGAAPAAPWLASIGLVAGGLGLQAAALALALTSAQRGTAGTRRHGGWWWVLLLVALPWLRSFGAGEGPPVVWWGLRWPAAGFGVATTVVFALWALLGAWRTMGAALQVPQRPFVWVAFLVWLAVFGAGFIDAGGALWRVAVALGSVAATAAYATLFLEPPRIDGWQRLAARWRDSGFGVATQQRLPLMAVSTALAVAGGAIAWLSAPTGALAWLVGSGADAAGRGVEAAALAWGSGPLVLALLALRDMALACALHWGRAVRRAEGATLVLLGVVNLVLPWFLFTAGLPVLAAWVQPLVGLLRSGGVDAGEGLFAVLAAAVQAAAALAWAGARWRAARPAD